MEYKRRTSAPEWGESTGAWIITSAAPSAPWGVITSQPTRTVIGNYASGSSEIIRIKNSSRQNLHNYYSDRRYLALRPPSPLGRSIPLEIRSLMSRSAVDLRRIRQIFAAYGLPGPIGLAEKAPGEDVAGPGRELDAYLDYGTAV